MPAKLSLAPNLLFSMTQTTKRLNDAYFNRFEGLWHHGDYIRVTERGGAISSTGAAMPPLIPAA